MRSLLQIVTFLTPIENPKSYSEKFWQTLSMIEDFFINNTLSQHKETTETEEYLQIAYTLIEWFHAVISYKKASALERYTLPYSILEIYTEHSNPDTPTTNDFLSTITHCFSGTFAWEYFVDIDSSYSVEAMNAWKKYNLNDIKHISLDTEDSIKNKKLLDALYYLRYTLAKNHKKITNYTENIDWIPEYLSWVLKSSRERIDMNQSMIEENIKSLDSQIAIVTSYFTHTS